MWLKWQNLSRLSLMKWRNPLILTLQGPSLNRKLWVKRGLRVSRQILFQGRSFTAQSQIQMFSISLKKNHLRMRFPFQMLTSQNQKSPTPTHKRNLKKGRVKKFHKKQTNLKELLLVNNKHQSKIEAHQWNNLCLCKNMSQRHSLTLNLKSLKWNVQKHLLARKKVWRKSDQALVS